MAHSLVAKTGDLTTYGLVSCPWAHFAQEALVTRRMWSDNCYVLISTVPRWLMLRMYCSHLAYCTALDVPDLTASHLLWGPSDQRWRCLWTFLFSNVPTFATSHLQEILAAKGGTTWARNGRWILPENARLPRNIQGPLTCRKSMTRDIQLWSRLNLRTWYQRPARYL